MSIFPIIQNINDVLPHIEGCEEFTISDRGTHTTISYNLLTSDTFRPLSTAADEAELLKFKIRRECRGIIFDNVTGEVIRRPWHKFKNVGEEVDTLIENLPFGTGEVLYEKLDGSMIASYVTSDGILHWGTKMGETEVSQQAVEFIKAHPSYIGLANYVNAIGATPIFEWCSRQQQIVIDHAEDDLILCGIRVIKTGKYFPFQMVQNIGRAYNVSVVKVYNESHASLDALVEHTRNLNDREGYVVAWPDGQRIKIKSDWYVAIHKMKDELLYERNVIQLVLDNKVDDVLAFSSERDQERLTQYQDEFVHWMANVRMGGAGIIWREVRKLQTSRKDWAINFAPNHWYSQVVFKNWDELQTVTREEWDDLFREGVEKMIRTACISNSKLVEFKSKAKVEFFW